MAGLETIDNLSLIENGLYHIEHELTRVTPSMFRAARESHLILYRSMIQALRGSSNLAITGRPSKDRRHQYRLGNEPWKEIHKVSVNGCTQAWRFTSPIQCAEPTIDYSQPAEPHHEDYLISFYDSLAMIQSECFMHKFQNSKEVLITDNEMRLLEWLHEDIRNEYEHFVPKGYSASIIDLIELTILSMRLSKELLFDSRNVYPSPKYTHLRSLFDNLTSRFSALTSNYYIAG